MSKLITASIDLLKIRKSLIKEVRLKNGTTAKFIEVNIWLNEEPDQFGNIASIEQRVPKGEPKLYLGNGKEFKPKDPEPSTSQPEPPPLTSDDLPF